MELHKAEMCDGIPVQSSFLGRGSGAAAALLAKSSSNFGNTRSFIFGCENRSNQGGTADAPQAQVSLCTAREELMTRSSGSIYQPCDFPVVPIPAVSGQVEDFNVACAVKCTRSWGMCQLWRNMQGEEGRPSVPSREGPTSFAGLHLGAGRAGLGRQRGSSGSLLSLLHTKEGRRDVLSALAGERDGGAAGGDGAQQVKAVLQSKRRAMRR